MLSSQRVSFALLFAILLVTSPLLHAQFDNGSLVGTVHDATGAPLANAAVTVANTATGTTSQLKTNAGGDYEAPACASAPTQSP